MAALVSVTTGDDMVATDVQEASDIALLWKRELIPSGSRGDQDAAIFQLIPSCANKEITRSCWPNGFEHHTTDSCVMIDFE
jgi:hypothetical protein